MFTGRAEAVSSDDVLGISTVVASPEWGKLLQLEWGRGEPRGHDRRSLARMQGRSGTERFRI